MAFDVSILKAVLNSIGGEIEIMLLAGETLFLRSCQYLSVFDKTCSTIVIEG
jgi:hypothetical protein